MRPASHSSRAIEFRGGAEAEELDRDLRVPAGKSLIMESSSRIVRASVANPELARAVSIDDHELLLNGKTPGRTNVTLWQEGGEQRHFDLYVEREQDRSSAPPAHPKPATNGPALTAAYQDAMDRVQTAITGVKR
jgi:Flp pilus assembly secretin CpaC